MSVEWDTFAQSCKMFNGSGVHGLRCRTEIISTALENAAENCRVLQGTAHNCRGVCGNIINVQLRWCSELECAVAGDEAEKIPIYWVCLDTAASNSVLCWAI